MASNTIITSTDAEKRWVQELDNCFLPPEEHMITVDFGTAASVVFRVPEMMSKTKPEAYAPQHLGLGPYHHFRPDLYQMHKQKVAAVRELLHQKDQLQMFKQVVDCLVQLEPVIRACYDEYLDLDIQTLARILAIDCLYFLHLLLRYSATRDVDDPKMEEFGGDIFMLENQIPLVLFRKVVKLLHIHFEGVSSLLFQATDQLCLAKSPLKLNQRAIRGDGNHAHLLQQMLFRILNTEGLLPLYPDPDSKAFEVPFAGHLHFNFWDDNIEELDIPSAKKAMDFLGKRGVPGAREAGRILSFIKKLPWDRINGLLNSKVPQEEENNIEELDIPSASEMSEKAGIQFGFTTGGIRDIMFDEEAKLFYLPVMNLKPSSEIVLRNLVAFEKVVSSTPESTREFAEYVDFMCGIIDTDKDVDILRKAKIIQGSLSDEEIVGIFNGIAKTTGNIKEPHSSIELAIDAGKKQYEETFSVKAKRLFRILPKSLRVFITVVFVGLVSMQAYCSDFGCSRWFDKK